MARRGNGSNDGLLLEGLALALPLSLGAWFLPELDQNGTVIAACRASTGIGFLGLRVRGDLAGDPLEAIQQENTPGTGIGSAQRAGVVLGQWQHGLGVFTSNASRTVYLNGAGTTETTSVTATTPDRVSLLYSARGETPSAYLGGAVAWAAVWAAALSAAEALALATGCPPWLIRPQSLVACWPLDGLNRAEEVDLVRGLPLAVAGTTWAADPAVVAGLKPGDLQGGQPWYAAAAAAAGPGPGPGLAAGRAALLDPFRSGVLGPWGGLGARALGHPGRPWRD